MSLGDPAAAAAQNYNYYMYLQSCNAAAQTSPAMAPSLSPPVLGSTSSAGLTNNNGIHPQPTEATSS
jgi:hypothetical protein